MTSVALLYDPAYSGVGHADDLADLPQAHPVGAFLADEPVPFGRQVPGLPRDSGESSAAGGVVGHVAMVTVSVNGYNVSNNQLAPALLEQPGARTKET